MLSSWKLERFKSVVDPIELSLSPLTLFTGANSSGKSSIIQSMLLTAQSLQSSLPNRQIVLNGHMARLGSFGDLVSFSEVDGEIFVGFELEAPSDKRFTGNGYLSQGFSPFNRTNLGPLGMEFSFSIAGRGGDQSSDLLALQPNLQMTKLSAQVEVNEGVEAQHLTIKRDMQGNKKAGLQELSRPSSTPAFVGALNYSVVSKRFDASYGHSIEGLTVQTRTVGAVVQNIIPRATVVQFDEAEARAQAQYSYLLSRQGYSRYSLEGRARLPINDAGISAIEQALASVFPGSPTPGTKLARIWFERVKLGLSKFRESRRLKDLVATWDRLSMSDYSLIISAFEARKIDLLAAFKSGGTHLSLDYESLSHELMAAADYIQEFFKFGLRYLGPLREDPKPIYPLAGTSDSAHVGFRGEFTAAVLHSHRHTEISYIPSRNLLDEGVTEPVTVSLFEAVKDWLDYMGVGSDIVTNDSGKLGHGLRISTDSTHLSHDLTQVGVGVSQVLPIVVLALIADEGSALIFEQPELHLHPRVQSRLADFFVSMTMLNKQCIIETHSEYIINRLRYLAVADSGDAVSKSVKIYFVEKNSGRSSYKQVSIDELGALDSWPAGFFDESELGTSAFLRRSLEKRRSMTKGKDAGEKNG
ncbi:AAA family ATPase [Stenotrophomonas maltophilia]|uniref:AAA family ATPase n=1 Tax=Stenotrophomonas maltophilia TaxID=40324 RepID=UPI0015DE40C3|nr:DUF3696 domain-containing protein [Stenotrophomonas maltophilia]